MTNPGGPDQGFALGTVQQATAIFGAGTGGIPNKYNQDQTYAEDLLKGNYVQNNPNINQPLDTVYSGLREGISLPLAIIEAIVKTIANIPQQLFLSVEHALSFLISIPATLFGAIQGFLSNISIGALSQTTPNLLPESAFEDGSLAYNVGGWVTDSGTLKVTADGTTKAVRSGSGPQDVILVGAGQQITGSIFVKHQGYSGIGDPIRLQVVPYTGDVAGEPVTLINSLLTTSDKPEPTPVLATYSPTGDLDWPGHEIKGYYDVPEGITGIQLRILITGDAFTGEVSFKDPKVIQSGSPQISWISGLPGALSGITGFAQSIVDTLLTVFTGIPIIGGGLSFLARILGLIPGSNILGAGGPATIIGSFFGIINAFLGGFVGVPGATGGSLADVTQVSGQIASQSAQGAFAWQLVNMVNNTPVSRGMLPTGRANYDITSANTFLPTTQSAALSASFGMLQAMPIGVISWHGYGISGITEFYVNLRKVNLDTGVRDLVHHSSNIVGVLQGGASPATADWMFYEIPSPIAAEATDYYYVEFVSVGGTHHIRGMSFTDTIADHPFAQAPGYGTTVDYSSSPNTPAASLPKAVSGPNVPWVEFAVSLGSVADHHEPLIVTFAEDGEFIPIPTWCNRVDAVPLGKGGDGHAPTVFGYPGAPGEPGKFAPVTWSRPENFTGDATIITFSLRSDGSAQLSIPGHQAIGPAGANGGDAPYSSGVGKGPGILSYNEQNYQGGGDQESMGGAGTNPGGGGAGGLYFQSGGVGGKAAGWVCFRQSEVPDETSGGDTTPPTAPSVALVEATIGAITITATGGTDA